jgi:hypothetical protein
MNFRHTRFFFSPPQLEIIIFLQSPFLPLIPSPLRKTLPMPAMPIPLLSLRGVKRRSNLVLIYPFEIASLTAKSIQRWLIFLKQSKSQMFLA